MTSATRTEQTVVDSAAAQAENPRRRARAMYWMGWTLQAIAEELRLSANTVQSWKRREKWDDTTPVQRVESSIEMRMQQLIAKEKKSGGDFKEIDLLGRQLERTARVRKYEAGGNETDLNPKVANRNSGPRKKAEKNAIDDDQAKALHEAFVDSLFGYQHAWREAGALARIRNILKSRQIGATWYFAREAIDDAVQTGRNQIFLSASKAQAHVFKQYIIEFVRDAIGVELRGDPIVLPNGATLYFLGTNARTAQSYHGNLYFDEYFWTSRFNELRKVASGMAMHKKWRLTYFSTPSSVTHEAYSYWSGAHFNRGRPKDQHVTFDTDHFTLKNGVLCPDHQWRQIVTVKDAVEGGCNLFDIDQLMSEYSPEAFANLLMCQFMDDAESAFPLARMMRCFVDSWDAWSDFKPLMLRPFGNRPVWVGYDPSNTGDGAGLAVVAPPLVPGGKFRILHRKQLRGSDYEAQAAEIRKLLDIYNVEHIGIDVTGLGSAVYQLVSKFFPKAKAINYSVQAKVQMVLKAQNVIDRGRLEFDAGWTDIAASFMQIRKVMTESGRHMTYEASRTDEASHADLAWATMHALINEPLEGMTGVNQSVMEMSE
jgi:uncharacterized protein YjcR